MSPLPLVTSTSAGKPPTMLQLPPLRRSARVTASRGGTPVGTVDTNTPVIDTGYSALEAAQSAIASNTQRITGEIARLTAGVNQSAAASQVIVKSIDDITNAKQVTNSVMQIANLQAQNATIDAFEAGGGTDAQISLMSQLAEDESIVQGILDEREVLASEDRFGEGIGLIDAALNQFNINLTNQQLAAATASRDNTSRQIANINTANESNSRVNQLTKRTINADTIAASYDKIAAEGQVAASKQKIENIHSNASMMNTVITADSKAAANLVSLYRLEPTISDCSKSG